MNKIQDFYTDISSIFTRNSPHEKILICLENLYLKNLTSFIIHSEHLAIGYTCIYKNECNGLIIDETKFLYVI